MNAPAPGQAPEIYRRWLRIDQPKNWDGPSDSLVSELWHEKSDEQKAFWRSLDGTQEPVDGPAAYRLWAEVMETNGVDCPLYARLGNVEQMAWREVAARMRAAPAPAGQLAEVRAVLEAFDWEFDDRQYALEKIDDIVNGRSRP